MFVGVNWNQPLCLCVCVSIYVQNTNNIVLQTPSTVLLLLQGLRLAHANLQNASENKKLRVQSSNLSLFFGSSNESW